MINIAIKQSEKLPGLKNAFITFEEYNERLINKIRQLSDRRYNADTKTWEISLYDLEYFIAAAKDYKIKISLNTEEKIDKISIPNEYTFKTNPYNYQQDGIEYGLNHDKFILADEQGCVSGDSVVRIKENNKKATREIKIKHLKQAFEHDNTVQIKCMVNNRFAFMPIRQVLEKGVQDTIRINLENTYLVCTSDHLIYTKNGWKEAGTLTTNDEVFTNGKQVCPLCGSEEDLISYPYSKFKGYCRKCMYKQRDGKHYKGNDIYKKIDNSGYVRLFGKPTRTMPNYEKMYGMGIYEHHQVWYEHTGHVVDSSKEVVHHINGVRTDNRIENLQLLTIQEHNNIHIDTSIDNLPQFNDNLEYVYKGTTKIQLVPKLQKVISIEKADKQMVYDIAIDSNEIHNFICNNIVVHNCGKTKQLIDIACIRKQLGQIQQCLIICCVNSIKYNWQKEVEIHSNEKAFVLGTRFRKNGKRYSGSVNDRIEDLKTHKEFFLITNMETLRNDEFVKVLNKQSKNIQMIALDESHFCRNPQASQSKGLLKLKDYKYKVAMSGTPIVNNPLDAYTSLKWLGLENAPYSTFKNYYCEYGGFGNTQVTSYRNLSKLRESLSSHMLRRLKTSVLDLPEKVEKIEYIEMSENQWKIYEEMRDEVLENIDLIVSSPNPLSMLLRLRQATGDTSLLSSTIKESAKLDRLEEIVYELSQNNRKCFVVSNWTQMTTKIRERLKKYNPAYITGEINNVDRQAEVDKFQTNDSCQVCIGTIGAAGTGLTLTAADTVIFVDLPWHRAAYDQCSDRIHRIGQKRTVTIIKMICVDTIDERIDSIVIKKGATADLLVDGKVSKLTKHDILQLIG